MKNLSRDELRKIGGGTGPVCCEYFANGHEQVSFVAASASSCPRLSGLTLVVGPQCACSNTCGAP